MSAVDVEVKCLAQQDLRPPGPLARLQSGRDLHEAETRFFGKRLAAVYMLRLIVAVGELVLGVPQDTRALGPAVAAAAAVASRHPARCQLDG